MTREGKRELWHTWRGPVMSLVGGIIASIFLAAFWWAISFKAYKQAVGDKLDVHGEKIKTIETRMLEDDRETKQYRMQVAGDLGEIKATLHIIKQKL